MKLISDEKWPDWLKRDPESGIWRVYCYREDKNPKRLDRTTGENKSIERAKKIGQGIYDKWVGHKSDGGKLRVLFSKACDETLLRAEGKVAAETNRESTLNNAKDYLAEGGAVREEFGHLFIDQITVGGTWEGFVARFQKQNPGKILYNHWKHMVMVMNYAHRAGYIDRPWEAKNPDPKKKVGRVLIEDEKAKLLKLAAPMLCDQLVLAMTMGMRLREILKLEWNRVDVENGFIVLRERDTKTKRARTMKMSPQAWAAMRLRRAGKFLAADGYYKKLKVTDSAFVFPARGNPAKPMHQNKTAWSTAKEKAGITDRCRFHDLRHTFLTECANLLKKGTPGVSIVHICNYAGLSIKTFEKVYLHLTPDDTAPVAALISVPVRESRPVIPAILPQSSGQNVADTGVI